MLPNPVRNVLNTAFEKCRPGQSEPILVGGINLLKPALRLMTWYRLVIEMVFKMTLDWRTDDAASDALAQSVANELNILGDIVKNQNRETGAKEFVTEGRNRCLST